VQSAKSVLASLQGTAGSLDRIITSPEVQQSLRSLDRSLANLDRLTVMPGHRSVALLSV